MYEWAPRKPHENLKVIGHQDWEIGPSAWSVGQWGWSSHCDRQLDLSANGVGHPFGIIREVWHPHAGVSHPFRGLVFPFKGWSKIVPISSFEYNKMFQNML